jgi:malate dehydrogenase (oxaloacetate-decarboxylating)
MTNLNQESLELHKKYKGKIGISLAFEINDKKSLSLAYTPGVAEVSRVLAADKENAYEYSIKSHTVAVVSDGSAVLGLGNIGPYGALPVMEGKAALFKAFGGVDAFPICLDTQNPDEIIDIVKKISPTFGGINLEDIKAPYCFKIEDALQDLGIPVFHDDQHGTAIVVLAAIVNAAKVTGKAMNDMNIIINGAGAAGTAIAKILAFADKNKHPEMKPKNIIMCDSKGIIGKHREDIIGMYKEDFLEFTNIDNLEGGLAEAVAGTDVFIGVSKADLLTPEMVATMKSNPIVFAMANPNPEISYENAQKAKIAVFGTGRSDYPNQINNVLAFPGIFRGALRARAPQITMEMKLAAAVALAGCVEPSADRVLPDPFEKSVHNKVADAVADCMKERLI